MVQMETAQPAAHARWVSRGRVPSLDGVRAAETTLVILQHATPSMGIQRGTQHIPFFLNAGHFGVTLFWLNHFCVRRGLELLPVFAETSLANGAAG